MAGIERRLEVAQREVHKESLLCGCVVKSYSPNIKQMNEEEGQSVGLEGGGTRMGLETVGKVRSCREANAGS